MDVEFRDKISSLVESDRAAETKLPISVINSFRDKMVVIRAAPDERTLREWKSLHYEKLQGSKIGERSIRLNKQWRVVFLIDTECKPNKIAVLRVEDYH
jgi:proteic killer suppression protein